MISFLCFWTDDFNQIIDRALKVGVEKVSARVVIKTVVLH